MSLLKCTHRTNKECVGTPPAARPGQAKRCTPAPTAPSKTGSAHQTGRWLAKSGAFTKPPQLTAAPEAARREAQCPEPRGQSSRPGAVSPPQKPGQEQGQRPLTELRRPPLSRAKCGNRAAPASMLPGRPRCTIGSDGTAPTAQLGHQPANHGARGDPLADIPTEQAPRAAHLPGSCAASAANHSVP
ncbi:hypothetical protein NDU88_004595 [Pleurodeles waltl]|uniref:Uncharacterized protein n=1 Tax=Pleurodeles waltl TaxID=8319 RepID=A0AAV7VJE1_PLEWA|nr:hypothetical protein NDU88_004595 [Pleurodeles waltl]